MKRLILGIVIGIVVTVPAAAIAQENTRTTKPIYRIKDSTAWVHVMDDGDNKCYLISSNNDIRASSISCVKK